METYDLFVWRNGRWDRISQAASDHRAHSPEDALQNHINYITSRTASAPLRRWLVVQRGGDAWEFTVEPPRRPTPIITPVIA